MDVYVKYNEWSDTTEIHILETDSQGRRHIMLPVKIEFREHKLGEPEEPSISIQREFGKATNFLQGLSDGLAKAGYRPKREQDNEGELKATKYHLEDLRKLTVGINK